MRRKDRQMHDSFAWEIVDTCPWAVLAMVDPDGAPYCVPVNIVRDGNLVYWHCAKEGFRAECLQHQDLVCMTCIGNAHPVSEKFTMAYESAVARGWASEVTEDEEKIHALRLLCQRHVPESMTRFNGEIDRALGRTAVWRLTVTDITGKRSRVVPGPAEQL